MVAVAPNSAPSNSAPSNPAPPGHDLAGPATPEAFLHALVASNFDFPAIAAATPFHLLAKFMKDPAVLAELENYTNLAGICLELRHAHVRSIALTALANLVTSEDEDTVERRRAATALLQATKPAAAKPRTPAAEEDSDEDGEDGEEAAAVPRPTCGPSSALTVEQVVEKLIQAAEKLNTPAQDSGLATIATFCDDDAELNGEPLPTDDLGDCIETLADTELSQIPDCRQRFGPDDLKVSGDTATCTITWSPAPGAACVNLKLVLKRAPLSRCPDAWLITSMHCGRGTAGGLPREVATDPAREPAKETGER